MSGKKDSPEDSPTWSENSPEVKTPLAQTCHTCGKKISLWHCTNAGCVWCVECGTNCNNKKDG